MMRGKQLIKTVRLLILLLTAGALLAVCTVPSELVLNLRWAEPVASALYRVAFFVRLPAFLLVTAFVPPDGDLHLPIAHPVASSFAAPFMWFAVWWLWKRKVRRALDKRRARKQAHRPAPTGPAPLFSRRRFLVMTAAATPFALGAGPLSYAALVAPQRLKVRRYAISVADLPSDLDGIRLVHISDTHYGPYVGKRFLDEVIEQANALRCDVAVLTGDYVHRTPRAVWPGIRLLRGIDTRLGAVAVLGNHDHWEGADACRAAFREAGIPLIDNDRLFLSSEGFAETHEPGRSVCFAGVGDLWEDKVLFRQALRDVPAGMPRIVLSHNPDVAEAIPHQHRVDLMCSGHTHGGQMRVPGRVAPVVPSAYGPKYAGGLIRGPRCPVVVSRGIGLALLPARFAVPPELVVIKLRRAESLVLQKERHA